MKSIDSIYFNVIAVKQNLFIAWNVIISITDILSSAIFSYFPSTTRHLNNQFIYTMSTQCSISPAIQTTPLIYYLKLTNAICLFREQRIRWIVLIVCFISPISACVGYECAYIKYLSAIHKHIHSLSGIPTKWLFRTLSFKYLF